MEGTSVNGPITYPRLPRDVAESRLEEQRELPPGQLAGIADTSHPRQEWHPTIPTRVTEEELGQLREDVVAIAARHGYPAQVPRGGHTAFDQQLAVHLYERMGIVPAEAAAGGMWSFLATEAMMFGGLFFAYSLYRFLYPGAFWVGSHAAYGSGLLGNEPDGRPRNGTSTRIGNGSGNRTRDLLRRRQYRH